jgi:hypothetical protein
LNNIDCLVVKQYRWFISNPILLALARMSSAFLLPFCFLLCGWDCFHMLMTNHPMLICNICALQMLKWCAPWSVCCAKPSSQQRWQVQRNWDPSLNLPLYLPCLCRFQRLPLHPASRESVACSWKPQQSVQTGRLLLLSMWQCMGAQWLAYANPFPQNLFPSTKIAGRWWSCYYWLGTSIIVWFGCYSICQAVYLLSNATLFVCKQITTRQYQHWW